MKVEAIAIPGLRVLRCVAAPALLLAAGPVGAVLIDGPDGSANTSAPPQDPGFVHVGRKSSFTAVYIGRGWVLTAGHVSSGPVILDGISYEPVPESRVLLRPIDGATGLPDLSLFRLEPEPPLPPLPIRREPPSVGLPVTMIGNGVARGPATTWIPPDEPPVDGWDWASARAVRWGTNVVAEVGLDVAVGSRSTRAFATEFSASAGPDECQAARGDSGGAVFIRNRNGAWELAGIMFAIGRFAGQPPGTALYGNRTFSADLSVYRDQILAIRDAPARSSTPARATEPAAAGRTRAP